MKLFPSRFLRIVTILALIMTYSATANAQPGGPLQSDSSEQQLLFEQGHTVSWIEVGHAYDQAWNSDGTLNEAGMLRVVELCSYVSADDPQLADYLHMRGVAYNHLGRYDLAIADYDRALQVRPSLVVLKNRGMAYANWNRPQEALRDLREFLRQAEILQKPPMDMIEGARGKIRALEAQNGLSESREYSSSISYRDDTISNVGESRISEGVVQPNVVVIRMKGDFNA